MHQRGRGWFIGVSPRSVREAGFSSWMKCNPPEKNPWVARRFYLALAIGLTKIEFKEVICFLAINVHVVVHTRIMTNATSICPSG